MNDVSKIISGRALNALTFLVVEIRNRTRASTWDEAGVSAALSKATGLPQCVDGGALTIAATKAALVPGNRTPAVIALDGAHWREPAPKDGRSTAAYYGPACEVCPRCRIPVTASEPEHKCERRSTPQSKAVAIEKARQQLADAQGAHQRVETERETLREKAREDAV